MLDQGCFSVLLWDGIPSWVALERTFDEGRVVIPSGFLFCSRDWYHKGNYETFRIHIEERDDLPGNKDRRILFHIANLETELEGCIGVATSFGVLHNLPAVKNSAAGFADFMLRTKGLDSFYMEVSRA